MISLSEIQSGNSSADCLIENNTDTGGTADGGDKRKPSLLSGVQTVSVLCQALQCCYGYIFEEEIYDTHMVISSLPANA